MNNRVRSSKSDRAQRNFSYREMLAAFKALRAVS